MDRLANGRLGDASAFPVHPNELKANGHREKPKSKPKAKGRFPALNTFIDSTMSKLTRADIVVWLVLFRDSKDGKARTGLNDIARRGGLSVRAVVTAVKKLELAGLLKVIDRGGLNRGPSTYQVRPINEAFTYEA